MTSEQEQQRAGAIIVAAGQGSRTGLGQPKQFERLAGKPILRHSAEIMAGHRAIDQLWIVIGAGQKQWAQDVLAGLDITGFVEGGATRQQSVWHGLQAMQSSQLATPEHVLIHDAARPFLPSDVIDRLLVALEHHSAAVPVMPVVDTIIMRTPDDRAGDTLDRNRLGRVQTPQAFDFDIIYQCHLAARQDQNASDDAQLVRGAGHEVAMVDGDERLKKYTLPQDFAGRQEQDMPKIRTGMGFDVHQLTDGEELWLGGVKIDHERGLAGHSDADVLLHALTDALLGAAGLGDIGDHFPPTDPQWKGVRSEKFVAHAVSLIKQKGGQINNVDMTVICEAPKIKPHREKMREIIATMLELPINEVSVKATTTERLGFAGRGEGIAAQAIATISMEN